MRNTRVGMRERERVRKKETTLNSKWTKPCRTGFKTRNSIYFVFVASCVFFFHESVTCYKCTCTCTCMWHVCWYRRPLKWLRGVYFFSFVHFYRIQPSVLKRMHFTDMSFPATLTASPVLFVAVRCVCVCIRNAMAKWFIAQFTWQIWGRVKGKYRSKN